MPESGRVFIEQDGRDIAEGHYSQLPAEPDIVRRETFGGHEHIVEGQTERDGFLELTRGGAIPLDEALVMRMQDDRRFEFVAEAEIGDVYTVSIRRPL